MDELKKLLIEKQAALIDLHREIRQIEDNIIQETWKATPVCKLEFSDISDGKCLHAQTRKCQVYCYHPNCHK